MMFLRNVLSELALVYSFFFLFLFWWQSHWIKNLERGGWVYISHFFELTHLISGGIGILYFFICIVF